MLSFSPFRVASSTFVFSSVGFTLGYSYLVLSGLSFDSLTFQNGHDFTVLHFHALRAGLFILNHIFGFAQQIPDSFGKQC
jgi:hypothetical protein